MNPTHRYMPEINILRAFAILAVIMIHSTSNALIGLSVASPFYGLYVFLHEFASFSVPLFIFISGFVLCYTNLDKPVSSSTVVTFYLKRMKSVIIPYTVFTVFYFILNYKTSTTMNMGVKFTYQWITGQAHDHLYFMFVIIQFLSLYPVFLIVMKRGWVRKHIWWIGILLQWLYYYFNRTFVVHLDGLPTIFHKTGSLFISYIAYYTLGLYIAAHYREMIQWISRRKAIQIQTLITIAYTLWVISGSYYVYLRYEGLVHGGWADARLFAYVWFTFNLLSALVLYHLSTVMYHRLPASLVQIGHSIGVCSFGIYLVHPIILYFYRKIPLRIDSDIFHLYYIGQYVSALLIAWVFTWLLVRHFSWSWLLFGTTSKQNTKHDSNKSLSASS